MELKIDTKKLLAKLSKQSTVINFRVSLDRVILLEELVERGVFPNKNQALVSALDDLLSQYFPELYSDGKLAPLDKFVKER